MKANMKAVMGAGTAVTAAARRGLLPDLVPDRGISSPSSSNRPDLESQRQAAQSGAAVPPRLLRRVPSYRTEEDSVFGYCWKLADSGAAETRTSSYRFRLFFRLLIWLILSVTNLVAGIIIPYNFSIILASCCLAVSSYIAAATIYQKSDDMNRIVCASLPVTIIILVNYISLAELVDIDKGKAVSDSALENMVEDNRHDRAACNLAMVTDLGLIGCALFVAEACFGLWREFNGEDPNSPPRILDLPVFNARHERRSSGSWDRAKFEAYARARGTEYARAQEIRDEVDDVDAHIMMSATRASDLH